MPSSNSTISTSTVTGPTARNVFKLAWPMTLKAIILHGTVVIDAYLVSALGETALAAMGLAAAIAGFVLGAILAFSNAMQIRTAQAFGTGDPVFLKSVLAAGTTLSLAVGLIGLLAISAFGGSLIETIAPSPEVADLSRSYLAVFSMVIIGEAIGQSLSSHFNGCGQSRIPLYSFLLSLPINVVTSIVLIHGYLGLPAFGVTGAAMGSAIAISVQVAFLIYRLDRLDGKLRHVPGWRQANFIETLKRHLAFSLPIAATFFSATFATHVCTLIYARLSLNEFAAMTLIAPWIMVGGTIGMQWAQATGIIIAQLLGRGENEAVLDRFLGSAWRGAFVAAVVVATVYLAVCLSASVLYADLNAQTRAVLFGFLPVLLVLPFPKGSNAICGNTLRASGDTIYVMHIFVWAQWLFRVPATALAVLHFDVAAIWVLSLLLWEEFLKFPAFHRRLFRGDWKRSEITE
ncbi:MATE family efflux transporter [Aliiruegeria lutimaris]|uniref:Na+-driven multidrug efflux pump n=1 Tax=Aliiruegeria lutimaris TaxID=571298 RepID=A0A1G8ULZ2_9RHOB|nr:MATE family efflux transporter [Aliiruegeria lutimaris]SDJ54781.1 Na+-driven multidrug efflux pump [Aliiruegeria lutimaris]